MKRKNQREICLDFQLRQQKKVKTKACLDLEECKYEIRITVVTNPTIKNDLYLTKEVIDEK